MNTHLTSFPVSDVEDTPIYDLLWSRTPLTVVAFAQEIGLFELLAKAPATPESVARVFGTTSRATEAVIAVLAALGFLQQDAGAFSLSPVGKTYLLPSSPLYYSDLIPPDDSSLQRLRIAFQAGIEPPKPLAVRISDLSEEHISRFIGRMHMLTLPAAGAVAQQPVFQNLQRLLDVGGGSGSLAMAIAAHNPHINITLMDLAQVCHIAAQNTAQLGLSGQIRTHAGDMFRDEWPKNYDGVLFGNVFHDWDQESCRALAQHALASLRPGGSILLHEMPLNNTKDGPLTVACLSIAMLISEKGKQYTFQEFDSLLTQVGFVDVTTTKTFGYYHLIQAKKPQ